MGEGREQLKFSAWRMQPRIDAGTAVWVCEKGHVDDHHFELAKGVDEAAALCSRCGGATTLYSLDQLAYELRHRRQQVEGLLAAIDKHRNESSPTSTPQKFSLDGELYAAADQVRKELGEG